MGSFEIMYEQNSGFLEIFQNSIEHNSKNIFCKNKNFLVNNQPRRYCEMNIILFPKTNLKRIQENLKNVNSNVLEKFSSVGGCLELH